MGADASSEGQGRKAASPVGRPPLQVDFVPICATLLARQGERGLISHVAREFGVSRAWLRRWVLPLIERHNLLHQRRVFLPQSGHRD